MDQPEKENNNSINTTLQIKLYLQNNHLPCSECSSFKLIKLLSSKCICNYLFEHCTI